MSTLPFVDFEALIRCLMKCSRKKKKGERKRESPGLVVMGGDSRSKGRGFESRHRILDGLDIFSH